MKNCLILSALVLFFSSCTKEYLINLPETATPRILYFDQFQRQNTDRGVLGMPQMGGQYTMLGRGINLGTPPASQIINKRWVTPDCGDVYAIQELSEGTKLNYVSCKFRWDSNSGKFGSGVMIILMGDMGGVNIAFHTIHIRINPVEMAFDVFDKGRPMPLNSVKFDEYLQVGKDYSFAFLVVKDTIYYWMNGILKGYVADPLYEGKVGKVVVFEHYYNTGHDENTLSSAENGAGSTL